MKELELAIYIVEFSKNIFDFLLHMFHLKRNLSMQIKELKINFNFGMIG